MEKLDACTKYKSFRKTKVVHRYMGSLALHNVSPKENLEDNKNCVYVAIPVYFLQESLDNCIFVPKYEKSSVI